MDGHTPPPHVSVLDWALLSLLQSVRSEFVDKIIAEWRKKLEIFKPGSMERLTTEQKRFMHNLYCALEVVGNDTDIYISPKFGDWTSQKIDNLIDKLDAKGNRLFNSYYYITINSYGDPGEYFFFPIVPGSSSLPRSPGNLESIALTTYLKTLRLPFEFRHKHRIEEYSGTLLPGRVGLTPQICLLAVNDHDKTVRPQMVPLFLGDFAILGKAEDAVQRHLSALIAPLVDNGECLGAFLLTSSLPDAYTDNLLEPEFRPAEKLGQVVTDWCRAPLAKLHAEARLESRDATIHVRWPKLEAVNLSTDGLKHAVEEWLQDLGESGAAAIVCSDGLSQSTLCAINHDSLAMSLRSTLSPGPLLSHSVYTVPHGSDQDGFVDAVSESALRSLLDQLSALGDLTQPTPLASIDLFKDRLKDFGGLVEPGVDPTSILIQTVSSGNVCAAAIYSKSDAAQGEEIAQHLSRVCEQVSKDAEANHPILPGERPRVYAALEALHHLSVHQCSESPPKSTNHARVSYEFVTKLLEHDRVLGVLLFEKADIFVAKACSGWEPAISKAVHTPATYWVFEQLCHLATMREFPVDRVKAGSDYFNPAPFVAASDSNEAAVRVQWSNIEALNRKYVSALNYLGVPVSDWKAKKDADLVISGEPGRKIAEFYRDYLRKLLSDATRVDAIERAVRTVHSPDKAVSIERIEFQTPKPGADAIEFTLHFRLSDEPDDVPFVWRRASTLRLEFSALNARKLTQSGAERNLATPDRPTSSMAWYPRQGWQQTEPSANFSGALQASQRSVEEKEALLFKATRGAISHESELLLRSAGELVDEASLHACGAPQEEAAASLAALRNYAQETSIERDLFRFQLLQNFDQSKDVFELAGRQWRQARPRHHHPCRDSRETGRDTGQLPARAQGSQTGPVQLGTRPA